MNAAVLIDEPGVEMRQVPTNIMAAALDVTIQQATILQLFFTHGVVQRQMIEEIAPHASVVVLRVGIKIQNRYGVGYMLTDDSRDVIQERVAAFLQKMPRNPSPQSNELGSARLT